MEFDWVWKAILIVIAGTFLLRVAGRKSISQMTLAQTVIMIGIGSLLIQPLAGKNVWVTIGVGLVLILTLILMEFIQVKGDFFEGLLTGKAKLLIENGILNEKNLQKLRITVDQLEMNLRLQNVSKLSDVEWATLEPNGRIGFILKQDVQPVTKREFNEFAEVILTSLAELQIDKTRTNDYLQKINKQPLKESEQENIFAEVKRNHHKNSPPKHLR
ncbi:DUF421 domain-containing protein [Oceanobacillus massiliensis]|uniref:DUF421 domain-containing protein n=1 Tax=Oceanobacillus massiliensis TaxID=1465765 RepID=UPI0002894A21|nr:DUF421 domain-containing protein [Oceanobacillus massiliensis]